MDEKITSDQKIDEKYAKVPKRIFRVWKMCAEYRFFLILLLLSDLLFGFFLWLLDERGFWVLIGLFVIASLGLFGAAVGGIVRREERRKQLVQDYLEHLEKQLEPMLLEELPLREGEQLLQIARELREKEEEWQAEYLLREEYEQYVETWAHEIKVPLSLMTLLLDNRREEMSPMLYQRMLYVKNQISEYVTQILYYARLKAGYQDYCLEKTSLQECCQEILEQYETVLAEQKIHVICKVTEANVVTDRKGLLFILEQAVGNACKYQDESKSEKLLEITGGLDQQKNKILLHIADNGIGVKQADLPFLFDRGFTGDTDERKRKATGVGLYLARQMAQNLNIEITAESEYGQGFILSLEFPIVEFGM